MSYSPGKADLLGAAFGGNRADSVNLAVQRGKLSLPSRSRTITAATELELGRIVYAMQCTSVPEYTNRVR